MGEMADEFVHEMMMGRMPVSSHRRPRKKYPPVTRQDVQYLYELYALEHKKQKEAQERKYFEELKAKYEGADTDEQQ